MFKFLKRRREDKEFDRLTRRGIFYYKAGNSVVKIDPLYAYIRIKAVGIDVMSEDVRGALRGDDKKLSEFAKNVRAAFGVEPYDVDSGRGFTIRELIRLYLAFYRYLAAVKKNAPLLRDFAPGLERRLEAISKEPGGKPDSDGTKSSSDSTLTPPSPSPSPDCVTWDS